LPKLLRAVAFGLDNAGARTLPRPPKRLEHLGVRGMVTGRCR